MSAANANEVDPPLSEDQQALMAYIDDEMTAKERAAFERRLAEEPDLAAETAELRRMADLADSMALAEPTDHEMRRFWAGFYNRSEWRLGWTLLIVGIVVLLADGLYYLWVSEVFLLTKIAAIAALAGALILLWNTLRLKIRSSRFDRYRGVMR